MKTIYCFLIAILLTLSTITSQSLNSKLPHENLIPEELNDSSLNGNEQYNDAYYDLNDVSSKSYTSRKKVANQSEADVYLLDSIVLN